MGYREGMEISFIDPSEMSPSVRAKIARNERKEWERFQKEQDRIDARNAEAEERWERSLEID